MSRLIPTSASNPCPICDDTKGKCRHGSQGDGYIQCMKTHSPIPGWHFLGLTDGGGLWGQFKPKTDGESERSAQKEAYRQRRELEKAEQKRRHAESLNVEARDREIRKLFLQLGLSKTHRESLQKRGFSEAQIEAGLFFSVYKTEEVFGIDAQLPGVNITGDRLNFFGHRGIACPILNPEGLAAGYQVRLDGETKNKYRWASGANKNRPNGPTSHLQNGELPIGFCKPEKIERKAIGLCEGTSIKPMLAAGKLGQICLGAAGGNFTASPKLFKQYLEAASQVTGTKAVELYPDAGSLLNDGVTKQYRRTLKLCKDWGYKIKIAWWGQSRKGEHPDIDELDAPDRIAYLKPGKWYQLIQSEKHDERDRLKREAEDKRYRKLTELSATPWKEIDTPKIDLEALDLEPGAIYIVKSAKGTSKTEALPPIVAQHQNAYSWFSRIALGREECHRIGLTWKDDMKRFEGHLKVGFCADSAYQFNPNLLGKNGLLILDEVDQVLDHTFGDTCNKQGKRPMILASLKAQIAAAVRDGGMVRARGMVLAMSADVTDREVELLREIAPAGCPVRVIVNHYKPQRGQIYLDRSDKPDGQIEELLAALERGQPCFVIDDMKNGVRGCKSIAEYARSVHPEWAGEIVEINSDTSGSEDIAEYLRNINTASQTTRLLCCSPSVVSGISITNGRFNDGVFAFLNGILTVSNASQAIARVRGAESIRVWVAEKGLVYAANRSTDPEEIKAWYQRNYSANAQHILGFGMNYDPMRGEWDSPFFDLYCKNAAYRNLCMERLGDRMEERLIEEGYTVHRLDNPGSDMVERGLKESWAKLEVNHAKAVAAAEILSDEELKRFDNPAIKPTPEEQLRIEKTWLRKNFGEELIEATTYEHQATGEMLTGYGAMCLKDNRGDYKRKLDQFYLLTQDAEEAIAKDVALENRQLEHGEGRFAGDVRWNTRKRQSRRWLGLNEFLDPERWWRPGDYWSITEKAKQYPALVKDCLNLSVEEISNGQVFGELMGQLGLELDKQWVARSQLKPGQRRYKFRKISDESWKFAQMYVAYRESLKEQRQESSEAEITPQKTDNLTRGALDRPPPNLYTEAISKGGAIQNNKSLGANESSTFDDSTPKIQIGTQTVTLIGKCTANIKTKLTSIFQKNEPSHLLGQSNLTPVIENEVQLDPIPKWRGLVGRLVEKMPEIPDFLRSRWDEVSGVQLVADGEPWLKSRENNDWHIWVERFRDGKRLGCRSIPLNWFELAPQEVAS